METYLTLLYLTLEQEIALKEFFTLKGWKYCKPDLSVMTQRVGPCETPTTHNISTKNFNSINDPQSGGGLEPKTSLNYVSKDDDSSQVKIEVPATDTNVIDDVSIKNDNDGNDDDADVAIAAAADDDPNDDDYEMNGGVSDDGDNDDDFADVLDVSLGETSTDNMASKVDNDGDFKTDEVIDRRLVQSIVVKALKSSDSGKEYRRDDFSTCPECKKSVRNSSIRRHILSHLNLPQKCGRCTMYFKSEAQLGLHKEQKHMKEHVCNYCGMKYRQRNSLNEHIQKQHEGTAKLFECKICGVQMARQRHLDDHMNTHKNVNPYTCTTCGKSYKNKCAYKRHNKSCGSGVKHACDICGQVYTTASGLRDHIKRCHEGRHDFKCVCGVGFKTRSARCRHRLSCETYKSGSNSVDESIDKISVINGHDQDVERERETISVSFDNVETQTADRLEIENGDLISGTHVDNNVENNSYNDTEHGYNDSRPVASVYEIPAEFIQQETEIIQHSIEITMS